MFQTFIIIASSSWYSKWQIMVFFVLL